MSDHLEAATITLQGNQRYYLGVLLRQAYKREQTKIANLTARFGAVADTEKQEEKLVFIDELIGQVLAGGEQ